MAPHESRLHPAGDEAVSVPIPLPDGRFQSFAIQETALLDPALAAAFPGIRTFRGAASGDRSRHVRLELTPLGFHAQITGGGDTIYVDPTAPGELDEYVSYRHVDAVAAASPEVLIDSAEAAARIYDQLPISNGEILRTYRLVVAATGEYTSGSGGTRAAALARITSTINRASEFFERDVAVRFILSAGPPADPLALLYTNPATDPYTNDNVAALIGQNQTHLDAVMGLGGYDIGHVFGTADGSGAAVSAACGPLKASGASGMGARLGDPFDVYVVAHELGHQLGGHHTFNSVAGSCAAVRSTAHAYEVGSGSTIMALPGLCAPENVVPLPSSAADGAHFHVESLNEITAFISSGLGAACGVISLSGNAPPMAAYGGTFTVPAQTPFSLTVSAVDADGDTLTYTWEQYNLGAASSDGSAATDDGTRPLFRAYPPATTPRRIFPSTAEQPGPGSVLPTTYECEPQITCLTGETLPTTTRTLHFMATVRDNRPGAGGITTTEATVRVASHVGPLAIVAPTFNDNWPALSTHTVKWSVNSTYALAAQVSILLSTDGGLTFPVVLAASTPNDGAQLVVMPSTSSLLPARIKVQAVGNIFFDVSDAFWFGPYVDPPGPFTKTAPAEGERGVVTPGTLEWSPSSDAWGWEYCIDTVPNNVCDTAWVNTRSVQPRVVLPRLPGVRTYWWQVRAVNGNGKVEADSGTWSSFTAGAVPPGYDDLAVDFGPGIGLWGYFDHGGATSWRQLHSQSPQRMVAADVNRDGVAELIVSFAGSGLWAYSDHHGWQQWSPYDVLDMAVGDLDGDGADDVAAVFEAGLWVRYSDGRFDWLGPYRPVAMAIGHMSSVGGPGELVASFAGAGIWVYRNMAEWSRLTPVVATAIHLDDLDGNLQDDVLFQFEGTSGAWVFYDNAGWASLHPYRGTRYLTGNIDDDAQARADVVVDFAGAGLWTFTNNSGWSLLHPFSAGALALGRFGGDAGPQIAVSFPAAGLWIYTPGTSWIPIHTLTPRTIVSGQINGN